MVTVPKFDTISPHCTSVTPIMMRLKIIYFFSDPMCSIEARDSQLKIDFYDNDICLNEYRLARKKTPT